MGKFFISCDQASILSTREQYGDLNPKEQFRHKLHKTYCLDCRSFHKGNGKFQRTINGLRWVKLSNEQKSNIKNRIEEAMKEYKRSAR
ncbi:hypothetical protein [Nonlabens xiamenensis]|uniref:hypothetical protein n=1 Tax=Nonlabens xiamenensis TaxID=2341043 RepID=UPI000F60B95C|nr:hypothetical protein [Nonlabens xiamenensis]